MAPCALRWPLAPSRSVHSHGGTGRGAPPDRRARVFGPRSRRPRGLAPKRPWPNCPRPLPGGFRRGGDQRRNEDRVRADVAGKLARRQSFVGSQRRFWLLSLPWRTRVGFLSVRSHDWRGDPSGGALGRMAGNESCLGGDRGRCCRGFGRRELSLRVGHNRRRLYRRLPWLWGCSTVPQSGRSAPLVDRVELEGRTTCRFRNCACDPSVSSEVVIRNPRSDLDRRKPH